MKSYHVCVMCGAVHAKVWPLQCSHVVCYFCRDSLIVNLTKSAMRDGEGLDEPVLFHDCVLLSLFRSRWPTSTSSPVTSVSWRKSLRCAFTQSVAVRLGTAVFPRVPSFLLLLLWSQDWIPQRGHSDRSAVPPSKDCALSAMT
ncbi:hypothetical protein MRX96_048282 [Rhipicephalus microplus]